MIEVLELAGEVLWCAGLAIALTLALAVVSVFGLVLVVVWAFKGGR